MRAEPMRARAAIGGLGLAAALLLAPEPALARTLFEEGELTLELRSAFKGSLLLAIPYATDPVFFPDSPGGAGLFRLRFDLTANLTEYFTASVAYEHRVRSSSGGSIGTGLLPSTAAVPFRLTAGDWVLIQDGTSYVHQHELDRAYVSLHFDFMELTVGRQAIGLGRGLMFSAVDVFAPFSPTEVDREWRRGIDAVHLELRIPQISELSADVIAAFGAVEGDELTSWSLIGRVRAILGDVDASVLLGRRAEDNIVGAVISANLGDAEVHAELAMFGTNGQGIDGGFLGTDAVVAKGVIGGSYVIDIGSGLHVAAEYHYSGFGVDNIGDDPSILYDPAFQLRFARGDSQLLGRHAIAASVSYSLQDDLSGAIAYIQSPVDGSGTAGATFTWNQSDNVTILLNVFVPWGTPPESGVPTSEWGSSPLTIFLQARLYD
ncbi:MAG: hypothetical protein H6719_28640 [Sandaracinaceae bacterium]|nr:hypothetical protein [Sandaracinaceae bacterium]